MMRHRRISQTATLALAMSSLFPSGGCSEDPDVALRAGPLDPETPLERAMGGVEGIVAHRLKAVQWQERQIALCMREKGWEYIPRAVSPASVHYDYLVAKYQVLIADDAFRARWGYGVATRFAPDGTPYPYDGALLIDDPSFVEDPNAELLLRLSPEQREAWQLALLGSSAPLALPDEPADAEASPSCVQSVADGFATQFPGFIALTRVEIELDRRTKASPEFSEATRRWQACMLENGFTVQDPLNPPTELDEQVGRLQAAGDLSEATLPSLQHQELAMAEVDWSCRATTLNPVRLALFEQVELEFLERAPDLVGDITPKEMGAALFGQRTKSSRDDSQGRLTA